MIKPKAIIIGTGVAGIALSIRLANKGYDVEVLEQNSAPGGKLTEISNMGYRFDAGPSLLTMPYLIDDLFALTKVKNTFTYQKLTVACKYFFADGKQLLAYSDADKRAREFEEKLNLSPKVLQQYLKKVKKIWNITTPIFLHKSLHKLSTYLSFDTFMRACQLPFIGIQKKMSAANMTDLKNKHAAQYFNRFATYNGSNPYAAPATLSVIAYPEHFEGAFCPVQGMYSITTHLFELAKKLGVTFQFDSPAEEIVFENKKAVGVITNNKTMRADVVISNCDIYSTYKKLMPKHPMPKSISNQERSSSAFIFYWGMNKTFANLDVHNIFFSGDYQKEFQQIWEEKQLPDEPTIYVNISAKYKEDDAPKGCENWFVMINVNGVSANNWEDKKSAIKSTIVKIISKQLGEDIAQYIVSENSLSPLQIEQKTGSYHGSLYGAASNKKLSAFFRQSNKIKPFKNLYCCGGSVHPGGGIPLCLLSAKITASLIPNPNIKPMKIKTGIAILCILYTVGIVGIIFPETRSYILPLTPINLALTFVFLAAYHKKYTLATLIGFAAILACGFFIEVAGIQTQNIFGAYHYGKTLGPTYWSVPFAMGINWFILIYSTRVAASKISKNTVVISLISAAIMVGLDWIMEPVAGFMDMWHWTGNTVPLQNYIAWFALAFFIQLLYQNIEKKFQNKIAIPVLIIQVSFFGLLRIYLLMVG